MIDVVGLVVLLAFYAVILLIGIFATRWYKKKVLHGAADSREVSLVAGRKLGGFVGIFTMTATTVGGGYINGTAESMATAGLAWTLAPFGIFTGLILGGLIFARRMREQKYLTMYDPFQEKYGNVMVSLLYLAGICGDVFWSASVLAALGTSLSVIINLNVTIAIVVSAVVALVYTMFGQVISVVYTDVAQLVFITVGLVLALPFVLTHHAVSPLATTSDVWLGQIPVSASAAWADLLIAMTLGTIPWQTYFQRVLSVKTARYAQMLSIAGGFGAFLLAIPPALIGMAATSTDWNQTDFGVSPLETGQASLVLPLCMKHLTPRAVSLLGLGAIAAAVMSSVDSAILSSASVFTHNIYKMVLHKQASDKELMWVQRAAILVVGAIAATMAIFVTSIYGIFIMAADIVFVIMFPQLLAVIFIPVSNAYGSLLGFCLGLILRFTAGEPFLNMPTVIHYPWFNYETNEQGFPYRSFAAILSLIVIVLVSWLTGHLFNYVPLKYDFLGCFIHQTRIFKVTTDSTPTSKEELLRKDQNQITTLSYRSCSPDGSFTQDIAKHDGWSSQSIQNGSVSQDSSESDHKKRNDPDSNPKSVTETVIISDDNIPSQQQTAL